MDNSEDFSEENISMHFATKYTPVTSVKVSEEETYCTHLGHDSSWDNISVSLSSGSVVVLKRDTLQNILSFDPHQVRITDLRFSPTNNNTILTSSMDGTVKLWDIRSDKCEREFTSLCEDDENGGINDITSRVKPLTAFDVSLDERFVCAGTEQVLCNSFLLFWDTRTGKSLGGYTESHSDDITQVKFHPQQADMLATASTDNLINVFDISQNDEDDALTYSLNADVTVDKLAWLKCNGKFERLGAVTDVHSVQYWDIKEASPLHDFSREYVTKAMKRKSAEESYVVSIDMLQDSDNPIVLVGSGMNNSVGLYTLKLSLSKGKLKPEGSLQSKQEQRLTRAALYQANMNSYITAGECGVVRAWNPEDTTMVTKQSVVKNKSHRKKPY